MTSIGWDCCRHGEGARLAFEFGARAGSVRKILVVCTRASAHTLTFREARDLGGVVLMHGELASGVAGKI
jgi:hypothetical protein